MAVRIREERLDDLTEEVGAENLTFAFDGQRYEIDLTPENRAEFASAIKRYVDAARAVGKKAGAPAATPAKSSSGSSSAATLAENKKIREWGNANGFNVPPAGKLGRELREAYAKAHPEG